ncbi:phage terminase small subunit [Acinetobacter baumannii]|uniref:Terminase n=1 Tax=Acinetobacter baumannii TaxID=470 RepID=A0AAX0TX78_ACIBA|nr:phage terminase small subunit [Acinetobacter baumannii]MCW3163079.1 phage terminase small subunit [Acinetobacter baumannii]PHQ04309.1 terminase [Acinetobacter baumannii]
MLSPARRHRLQALAAKEAVKADEFGGVRPDASVYQLQLTELKNDIHVLRSIQSQEKRAEAKKELIPKHMPYVLGVVQSGAKVEQDEVITTIMLWCFDCCLFEQGLSIAEYALEQNLKMPDSFSRSTATIVAEEIGNAARIAYKQGEIFKINILEKAHKITTSFDMPDEVRAKLLVALGRSYLQSDLYHLAVLFLKSAIAKHENCGGKQDLQKAEKLLKEQSKNSPEPMLNADGSQVVDDQGNLMFHPT